MSSKKRILIVVMDGLGDRGCEELGGLTPLQATETPNLDWFTKHGTAGTCDTVAPGVRPGSDTSHLSILGYDPLREYTGRGPFEAAGIGLIGRPGDVAFRCNFSTCDDSLRITDRRAGRVDKPDTEELLSALDGMEIDGAEALVRAGTEHRAALILRGEGLDARVTDADPHEEGPILQSRGRVPEAERTARILNEFVRRSYGAMRDHPVNRRRIAEGKPPANVLVPRGAGEFPHIRPFPEIHGMSAACVAGVGMIKGICGVCGLDVLDLPPECTGGAGSDFSAKMRAAMAALERYDFVLMNCKAPDVAGHDRDPRLKCDVISRLDEMAGVLREGFPPDLVVAFTADHSTPCSLGDHSGDPVPIAIYTPGNVMDDASVFSESGCAHGRIGRIAGRQIVPICMDLADRVEKFGA
ncbi:MAG: 2,3-bisphosphoglycerate-independent phosphoglycerate mutase [Candidatus Methanoplasma sp.]|jgi:2,3-bisphosphoglycerate-independent phosphoglycerate mutase|nr:2,3-bisphosphoglycerate-independent phosphoglycerate mutase [Candidatus Methanoplasma sp.]